MNCLICRQIAGPNTMGIIQDDSYTLAFSPLVCQRCADRVHGVLEETILTMTASEGMTTEERIERFVARLRTGRVLNNDTGSPTKAVDDLLRGMGLNPGEAP